MHMYKLLMGAVRHPYINTECLILISLFDPTRDPKAPRDQSASQDPKGQT